MVHNPEKLELATQFRKRGFTYTEIAKLCGVSKGTVSNWLAKKRFSKQVKKDNLTKATTENTKRLLLIQKTRQTEQRKRLAEIAKTAQTEFKHYQHTTLFTAGIMAYLASGDQKDVAKIRLSSNDPVLHRIFIKFLTEFLGLEKKEIKIWLLLPEGVPETKVINHWSKQIALPKSQFGKSQFLSHNKKRPLHNGTGNTIIASTLLKHKLNTWIELLRKEL